MSFDRKNQLIVSDERSRVFLLNLSSKKVTQLKESCGGAFLIPGTVIKKAHLAGVKLLRMCLLIKDSFVPTRDAELVFYFDDCSKGP